MFENNNYPVGAGQGVNICEPYRPPSVLERLTDEKTRCEQRLAQINEALALLDRNPDISTVLECLSKIGF